MLDSGDIRHLAEEEIRAILRSADETYYRRFNDKGDNQPHRLDDLKERSS